MRTIAVSLTLLAALAAGCKKSSSEPRPPDPVIEDSTASSEDEGPSKPDGCTDVEDCATQGTLAVLAGEARGIAMLDYACFNDSATGCQNLSTVLRSSGLPEDAVAAHIAAERGCKLGNPGACVDLGVDESLGLGGAEEDSAAALKHFTTACDGGAPAGCRYIGVLHVEGKLGSPDAVSAMNWFEIGCDKADAESCFNAGAVLVNGLIGDPDLEAAAQFMTRACELADQDGCAALDAINEKLAAEGGRVPGSNLRIGTATVDGLTVEELECRVEGGGLGLLGNMALIGALAERKAAIDKCGKKGTLVDVTWTASGGKIHKAEGADKEGECVAKVLKKLSTPVDGECAATILLGS